MAWMRKFYTTSTEMKAIYVGFSLCMLFLVPCTILKENSWTVNYLLSISKKQILWTPWKVCESLDIFFEAVWPNERFFGHESIILDADASQCLKKVSERAILIFMCPDRDTWIRYLQNFHPVIAIQFEKPLMILGSVLEWLFCQAQELFVSAFASYFVHFFTNYFIPLSPVSTLPLATSVNSW